MDRGRDKRKKRKTPVTKETPKPKKEEYVPEEAYGGAKDENVNAFAGPSFMQGLNPDPAFMFDGGGRGDQTQRLQMLADLWGQQLAQKQAMQIRPEEAYEAEARAYDPVGYAQRQREARLATDPWGPGGQFEGRRAADLYTPEEILATQGNTAQNQIMSMRKPLSQEQAAGLQGKVESQRAPGEFDPEELRRLNEQYTAMRTYS
jgi:FKBP-type peptidyl-prolyl cis-trans isomerase 2